MEQLGLGGSRGTIIGGFFRRGISGAHPARWVKIRGKAEQIERLEHACASSREELVL